MKSVRTVYRFADFELDLSAHCMRRDGVDVHLRPKVFEVLVYLVRHHTRVVSKQELLKEIWGGTAVTDDVVFGSIIDIRNALADDRRARFVKTFPKAGYRFVAPVQEVTLKAPAEQPPPSTVAVRKPPEPTHRRSWIGFPVMTGLVLCALAAIAVLIPGSHQPPPLTDEVGWWRFDEGSGTLIHDASGSRNHGTVVDRAEWIDGKLGKAIRFEHGKGHVEGLDRNASFPRGGAPRTITAWLRSFQRAGEDTTIFLYGKHGLPLDRHFDLFLSESGKAGFGYGNLHGALRSRTSLEDGAWHFVAGAYEGPATNIARLYVDGVLEASGKLPQIPQTSADPAWKLAGSYMASTRYRGDLDDVRLYRRPLRAAQVQAMYRCSGGFTDFSMPGKFDGYFLPVFGPDISHTLVAVEPPVTAGHSSSLTHTGLDFGGIQFARRSPDCAVDSFRGADVGQDLYMSVDVRVPYVSQDDFTSAGPYFRSRSARPGDGVLGGTSAGYWVQLTSEGVVKVIRMNPMEVVALSAPLPGFDPEIFHRAEANIHGESLEVSVDGARVTFVQEGQRTDVVSIPPLWDGRPPAGNNQGAAGVAFASYPRFRAGGQQAKNLVVLPYEQRHLAKR